MNRSFITCFVFLCLFLFTNGLWAQVSVGEKGTIKGTVYSDYYWMAQHHSANLEGQNGFWFRRIYFTYEQEFNDSFSSRLRFEGASPGDFQSGLSMVPDIKDAYLKWEKSNHQIYAGLSSTPTFGLTEDIWGYRSVEKSPQDLYDFGSSRDLGLSFKGEIGKEGSWNYHFFVGNGNGNKSEINKGKKLMFALSYDITEHIVVEGYVDWNDGAGNPNTQNSYTMQGFSGYQSDTFNMGMLYSYQIRESMLGGADTKLDLVSIFANFSVNNKVKAYLRADHMFDGYPGGSDNSYIPFAENAESTFVVGGADIRLEENIHLMPNVEAIMYGEGSFGITPKTDIIPRLTLSYKF